MKIIIHCKCERNPLSSSQRVGCCVVLFSWRNSQPLLPDSTSYSFLDSIAFKKMDEEAFQAFSFRSPPDYLLYVGHDRYVTAVNGNILTISWVKNGKRHTRENCFVVESGSIDFVLADGELLYSGRCNH